MEWFCGSVTKAETPVRGPEFRMNVSPFRVSETPPDDLVGRQ